MPRWGASCRLLVRGDRGRHGLAELNPLTAPLAHVAGALRWGHVTCVGVLGSLTPHKKSLWDESAGSVHSHPIVHISWLGSYALQQPSQRHVH